MAILKFRLEVFGEMAGIGGVLFTLQSLSTIKSGTTPSNFPQNEPFSKFLRQLLRYQVPLHKTQKINSFWTYNWTIPVQV